MQSARQSPLTSTRYSAEDDLIYESQQWPVLHEFTVKYQDPQQKELLGLNGHWSLVENDVPHVHGGGTLDGKRWSLSFSEFGPTMVTVEGCYYRGDQCLLWNSSVVRTVADLVRMLNQKFPG